MGARASPPGSASGASAGVGTYGVASYGGYGASQVGSTPSSPSPSPGPRPDAPPAAGNSSTVVPAQQTVTLIAPGYIRGHTCSGLTGTGAGGAADASATASIQVPVFAMGANYSASDAVASWPSCTLVPTEAFGADDSGSSPDTPETTGASFDCRGLRVGNTTVHFKLGSATASTVLIVEELPPSTVRARPRQLLPSPITVSSALAAIAPGGAAAKVTLAGRMAFEWATAPLSQCTDLAELLSAAASALNATAPPANSSVAQALLKLPGLAETPLSIYSVDVTATGLSATGWISTVAPAGSALTPYCFFNATGSPLPADNTTVAAVAYQYICVADARAPSAAAQFTTHSGAAHGKEGLAQYRANQ